MLKQDFTTTLHSTTIEEYGEDTHKAGGAAFYQLSMEGNHDNCMTLNYQEPLLTMNETFPSHPSNDNNDNDNNNNQPYLVRVTLNSKADKPVTLISRLNLNLEC